MRGAHFNAPVILRCVLHFPTRRKPDVDNCGTSLKTLLDMLEPYHQTMGRNRAAHKGFLGWLADDSLIETFELKTCWRVATGAANRANHAAARRRGTKEVCVMATLGTVEQQDRLETGHGIATVIVRGYGTARRKKGEEWAYMLNVQADVLFDPKEPAEIAHLVRISAIEQAVYIGSVADLASIATVKSHHKTASVVLVIQCSDGAALGAHALRIGHLLDCEVELWEAQLTMPLHDDGWDLFSSAGDDAENGAEDDAEARTLSADDELPF
jgi:hypothetical protein